MAVFSNQFVDLYPKQLHKRQEIQARLLLGHSQADIARDLGISRQRVSQIAKASAIDHASIVKEKNKQFIEPAVEKLLKGESLAEVAESCGISKFSLRTKIKSAGFNYDKIREHARAHRFDGQTFGYWTALPGTFRREQREGRAQPTPLLTCVCECGTVRDVMLGNLQGGISRGCGCRNSNGERKTTPWEAIHEGNVITHDTTASLAKELGVNYLVLSRRLNRGETYTDKLGREWKPQLEKQKYHQSFKPSDEVRIKKIQTERIESIMANPDKTDIFAKNFFQKIWDDFMVLFQ